MGERSSGPAGSCVPGLSGGSGSPGRSGSRLTQCVGMSGSERRNFVGWSLMGSYPTPMATVSDPELESIAWDLEDLVDGSGSAGVDALLDEATERAESFAASHAGKVAEL